MRRWQWLASIVAMALVLAAASGGATPADRLAGTARAAQAGYSMDQCLEALRNEDLPADEQEAQRQRNGPICASIIAALPGGASGGYDPESFVLCAGQAGGSRVTAPGAALNAAIKQCIQQASPEAIETCKASVLRIVGDADPLVICRNIYQGTPLGVTSVDVLACISAQFVLGEKDFNDAGSTCYTQLATDEAAERAIQQAAIDEQPPTITTTLPGADDCLRLMGSGAAREDTAEARCAFILQAAPSGVNLAALARCIGNAADFQEAYRRCAEMLAALASSEPVIGLLSCAPASLAVNARTSCTASITGTVTSWRWTAGGGSPPTMDGTPSGGAGQAQTAAFTTSFATVGDKTVELTACNRVPATAGQPERDLCASSRTSVAVREGAPKITALGCTASVAVNAAVSCSPTIEGTATSRTWTAAGGLPDSGNGPTFSTRFAAPGAKQVVLEACNGSACSTAFQPVTVTGEAKCTQWNITGTWQTTQGNGYSPTFSFQQSGTTISGTATVSAADASRGGFRSPSGPITGSLVGDQLSVTVTWTGQNGPVTGRYTATIVQGRLTNGNAGGQTWNGTGPTQCASQ